MIDFVRLQNAMKERLERDRTISTIDAEGATLEDAVADAAALLNLPVRRIEYEVVTRGFTGFMGTGVKNWKIQAYERVTEKTIEKEQEEAAAETAAAMKEVVSRDGRAFIQLRSDGAYLKVSPPVHKGRRMNESAAVQQLAGRGVSDYDAEQVAIVVREAAGQYVRVGSFERMPSNDTLYTIDVTADEMKAYITVTPPGLGGIDITYESYVANLRGSKAVSGVCEEALSDFADAPVYKEAFLAAEGTKAVNGRDAYIQYHFETDLTRVKLKEGANGRVNFKELNIIQNVFAGQLLAVRIPSENGVAGMTVTGKVIPAKNGKDISMPLGKNVRVSEDGDTIIAEKNGQVVIANGKINVEPVFNVQGNVNIKTGNIIFLGTVIVSGNVEDGFSVKASGNIEINGTVEKAELDAEGDIIVHQGITGTREGLIRSGRSLWARFIENARIEAGSMVVVSDGIINSQVDAFKGIICNGKRASIVGGRLRATEEINAKSLGSPTSGTETICEVGFDPKSKQQLEIFQAKQADMEKQLEEIHRNIQTLINIKKQRKSLPEDKEAYLAELMDKRKELSADFQKNKYEIEKIHEFLNGLKTKGKISASSKVFPGVRIIIRDAQQDVKNEYKAVTFILENGLVRVTKYEEPSEESKKAPDGYIAD